MTITGPKFARVTFGRTFDCVSVIPVLTAGGDRGRDVAHRGAAVELEPGALSRQPRTQVPEEELGVDRRAVIALRKRGDEGGRRSGDDGDTERNCAVRLRGQRTFDRLVDDRRGSEDLRRDEDLRRSEL